jgi:hypothetical protein
MLQQELDRRHCERSEAIQSPKLNYSGLLRLRLAMTLVEKL